MLYQKNITEKGSARKEDGKGMNVLLRAEGLMKTYGAGQSAVKALNSVSLEIRKGDFGQLRKRKNHRNHGKRSARSGGAHRMVNA